MGPTYLAIKISLNQVLFFSVALWNGSCHKLYLLQSFYEFWQALLGKTLLKRFGFRHERIFVNAHHLKQLKNNNFTLLFWIRKIPWSL
jgi:hypothetical protein